MKAKVTLLLLVLSISPVAPGIAGDLSSGDCSGRVTGVAGPYNQATGSGFLALRAGPKAASTQLGELFQGDRVVILGRSGKWLKVSTDNQGQGWVAGNYISSSCK